MGNIIVGLGFLAIFVFAFKKVYSDAKNKKCSCGSSCSDKSKCGKC
jgi:hypothetical protein